MPGSQVVDLISFTDVGTSLQTYHFWYQLYVEVIVLALLYELDQLSAKIKIMRASSHENLFRIVLAFLASFPTRLSGRTFETILAANRRQRSTSSQNHFTIVKPLAGHMLLSFDYCTLRNEIGFPSMHRKLLFNHVADWFLSKAWLSQIRSATERHRFVILGRS